MTEEEIYTGFKSKPGVRTERGNRNGGNYIDFQPPTKDAFSAFQTIQYSFTFSQNIKDVTRF